MSIAINHQLTATVGARIYNHDIMNCTNDNVVGNHLYSGRALGLTEPDDIIQLHPDLKHQWPCVIEHYRRVGLSHSQRVVWDVSLEHFQKHSDYVPSVFFFGENTNVHTKQKSWYDTVQFINSKNNFITLANILGVPTPTTYCYSDKYNLHKFERFTYPCYLKAAVSVAGKDIYRCETPQDLVFSLNRFPENTPLQIQEEVKTNIFLNLQYEIKDSRLVRLAVTEQILDGYSHQGNQHPARYEPWTIVEPMAQWLAEKGMQGIFAFDVAVVNEAYNPRFLAIECNPRFNGASYPTLISKKLRARNWYAVQLTTRYKSLADIDLYGLEYSPKTLTGIVIFNWGSVLAGKLGVLLIGPRHIQQALLVELQNRL
ncbi:hypothetical protein [Kaarinaea lacus]